MDLATRDWILQRHFLEEQTYLVSILGREKVEGGASLGRYCKHIVEIIPITIKPFLPNWHFCGFYSV